MNWELAKLSRLANSGMKNVPRDIVIVIPTYNEEKHIASVVEMLSRDQDFSKYEIFVCDGMSSDNTVHVAKALDYPNLTVVENKKKSQAAAVNLIAGRATVKGQPSYLIRIDAHSEYPENFVKRLITVSETLDADSVVVPMRTVCGNDVQNAAHVLFNSWLGNGGAAHREQSAGQWVDHGHHALFRLEAFLNVGGYDEGFLANEDAELDLRLINAGHRIYLDGENAIGYVPRETVSKTWKQMRRNGFYRLKNLTKHSIKPKLRQLLPMLVLPYLFFTLFLSIFISPEFLILSMVYFVPVSLLSWRYCGQSEYRSMKIRMTTFLLAIATHTGFSFGATEFAISHAKTLLRVRKTVS